MANRAALLMTTALIATTTAASADITPEETWGLWSDLIKSVGDSASLTATERMSGDTLTVSDIQVSLDIEGPEGGDVMIAMDRIVLEPTGDGSVSLTMSDVISLSVDPSNDEDSVSFDMVMASDAVSAIASGDPDNVTLTYTAGDGSLKLQNLVVDGTPIGENVVTGGLTFNTLGSETVYTRGANGEMSGASDITMDAVAYQVSFNDPSSADTFSLLGRVDSISQNAKFVVPADVDFEDMGAALQAGLAGNGGYTYTGAAMDFAISEDGDLTTGKVEVAETSVAVSLNEADGILYDVDGSGIAVQVTGGEIPFPFNAEIAEVGFDFKMPLAQSDTPSDFAFGLNIAEFATSDMLWAMVDPGQVLPRDPITFALDLSGKVTLLNDLLDPEQMDNEDIPGELQSLSLDRLLVSAAGALLTGNGAATFDNSDLETFDGFPRPIGEISLALEGGNGLLDNLVQMGLLPQEQAMGARMMMGLFARPGEGEDSLTSTLEINEQGHILANGQRIQ